MASINDQDAMNSGKNIGDFIDVKTNYALSTGAESAQKSWCRSMTFPSDKSDPLMMSKIDCTMVHSE